MHLPTPTEGGSFAPPPPGTHPAICYRFIDLGTQVTDFQGERKTARKVMISWEITDPDVRMDDGRPFIVSSRYTWSMHEKATLRKTLESWRGVPFQDGDFGPNGFNVKKLIGVGCFVSVIHQEKAGKTYANITGIVKLPKNMSAGELTNETVYFSLDDFDRETFNKLGEGLQKIIKDSPEYQSLMRQSGAPVDDYPSDYGGGGLPDDDVPF